MAHVAVYFVFNKPRSRRETSITTRLGLLHLLPYMAREKTCVAQVCSRILRLSQLI